MKSFLEKALKDYKGVAVRLSCLLLVFLSIMIYVQLNDFRGRAFILETPLDSALHFNKYFVVPYLYWYLYLGAAFFYFAVADYKKYFKLLFGIIIGMFICYVIYYFYPTEVPRPDITEDDLFSRLVLWIYKRDKPYNCFPSIHVLDAVLIAIYINRERVFLYKVKIASSAVSFSIILSTFMIKQHYVYDAAAGAAIAYFSYFIFNYRTVYEWIALRRRKNFQEEAVVRFPEE